MAEGRPFPWRLLTAVLLPCAGLAAGVGLQRWFEGVEPAGDAIGRWLWFSSGAGLILGAAFGLALSRRALGRALWPLWGAAGPWAVAGLLVAGAAVARPIRERVAQGKQEACRGEGRKICSPGEFRSACRGAASADAGTRAGSLASLGDPLHKRCDAEGCTERWSFAGPWDTEGFRGPGAQLCSVVTDPTGRGIRWAVVVASE
jgi:hypothetical protein